MEKPPRFFRRLAVSWVGLLLGFLLLDFLSPVPPVKTYSQVVYAADSSLLCAYLTPDDKWRLKTSLNHVSEDLVKGIIAKEDRYFYLHPGVNPFSLLRAFSGNLLSGRRISGASTLTMQLARMAQPAPRTYLNKIKEMFRAFQYEWHYSKQEVLEMYLSYLPYGGNVEGVHSAAYLYFDQPPDKLSLSQALLLAVIPNRPNSLRLDRNSEAARIARDKWIDRFEEEEVFSPNLLDAARGEPVPSQRFSLELETPHFCQYLRSRQPQKTEIFSLLDPGSQKASQRLLSQHVIRRRSQGLSNGAVLVIDNQNHSVLAYCGSADFFDNDSQGQVDGIRAIRSPGSTLKPAVYAMAFDQGLLTPKTRLLDLPTTYKGFTPENYDLEFNGDVTTHFALAHSLNIPVVRLLSDLGLESFLDVAERSGFETIRQQKQGLGLSAILGGCGVTLEELSRFYTTFASGGQQFPLRYLQEDPAGEGQFLFSEGSNFLIGQILSSLERPDLPREYLEDSRLPKVAWKTGTSYGRRDAWAMGYSPRFTIGVWMGNFDGHGVPGMSGTSAAVPLLLDLFNTLDYDGGDWFEQPVSLQSRKVCSESGLLPGPGCKHIVNDDFLPGFSSLLICDFHKKVYVDASEAMQYCPSCLPAEGYKILLYPDLEPELALWYAQNDIPVRKPPPHNPTCTAHHAGVGPRILSPNPDFAYYLERGNEQEILLQAAAEPTATRLYWYVNGKFLQQAAPEEKVFYLPSSHILKILCMDDKGRKSETEIEVNYY